GDGGGPGGSELGKPVPARGVGVGPRAMFTCRTTKRGDVPDPCFSFAPGATDGNLPLDRRAATAELPWAAGRAGEVAAVIKIPRGREPVRRVAALGAGCGCRCSAFSALRGGWLHGLIFQGALGKVRILDFRPHGPRIRPVLPSQGKPAKPQRRQPPLVCRLAHALSREGRVLPCLVGANSGAGVGASCGSSQSPFPRPPVASADCWR